MERTLLKLARELGYRVVMSLANSKKAGSAALIRCGAVRCGGRDSRFSDQLGMIWWHGIVYSPAVERPCVLSLAAAPQRCSLAFLFASDPFAFSSVRPVSVCQKRAK